LDPPTPEFLNKLSTTVSTARLADDSHQNSMHPAEFSRRERPEKILLSLGALPLHRGVELW
ncbi:MAG: hypothetical protein ACREJC_20805, partial [Tepidisphaeraceae bacterium]